MDVFRRTGLRFLDMPPMVQAAILMIVGALFVATQNAMIRIASAEIHTFEIVFFRNLFGLAVMLPLLLRSGPTMLRVRHPGELLLMSLCHLAGMVCYFLAIAYLPLADVIALSFSKPLFVTLGAALLFGRDRPCAPLERRYRWSFRRGHRLAAWCFGDLTLCADRSRRNRDGSGDLADDQAPDRSGKCFFDRLVSGAVRDRFFAPALPLPLEHADVHRMVASCRHRGRSAR